MSKRKCGLSFVPVDYVEHHSPSQHCRLKVSSMFFPVRRFTDAEARFLALTFEVIVSR